MELGLDEHRSRMEPASLKPAFCTKAERIRMGMRMLRRTMLHVFGFALLCVFSAYASAEIIDDITLSTDANGDVDAVVKFTVPIQYLRHFPQGKSPHTSIYFNILGSVPADEWQDYESRRTPPSDVVQGITISTRDRGTGPKVQIQFYRPAEFTVKMGSNSQILVIHIKSDIQQKKSENKPVTGVPNGAALPLAAVPLAVLPVIPKSLSVATPSATLPTVSSGKEKPLSVAQASTAAPVAAAPVAAAPVAAAPVAAAPVAAAPVAAAPVVAAPVVAAPVAAAATKPVVPAGDVTAPKVVLAPSQLKPIHIPLGGTDGLPVFPDIDQVVPQATKQPSEQLSLTAQIMKANNDAAALMVKGGNALLTGQPFVATAAFNDVLKLPPNKYTQDAQLWVGIAKERAGQLPKAILEFQSYLKLYPDGKSTKWVKDRLAKLKVAVPAVFADLDKNPALANRAAVQNTEFQVSEFGSLSMYYYQGASQTNTATTAAGSTQAPQSISGTDQKSLMANVNVTARSYNNRFDNRLVFQNYYAANFLPGQKSNGRLGAAYYELKDRIANYSVKVGRQSGLGGGVMGRFDGVSAGYGFASDYRVNIVTGRLADVSLDSKPAFYGTSLDFGVRNPLGGSVYIITQALNGITGRRAVGGNLRYFDQRFTLMSMLDYDIQFKALNMVTVQGTLNSGGTGTDYNFLVDRRRSPILDIRNAVNGTGIPMSTLTQAGFNTSDLLMLANQRTAVSTLAQIGMTNHLNEKWNIGTDFTIAKTGGLPRSGGNTSVSCSDPLNTNTPPTEVCLEATPSSGSSWTISERMTGLGVLQPRDITNFNLSYTKGPLSRTTALQISNHADLREKWTLDSTLRLSMQSDSSGGKANSISPTVRATYQVRNNLTADAQFGVDWTKTSSGITDPNTNSATQSTSKGFREFVSFGFRLDF